MRAETIIFEERTAFAEMPDTFYFDSGRDFMKKAVEALAKHMLANGLVQVETERDIRTRENVAAMTLRVLRPHERKLP